MKIEEMKVMPKIAVKGHMYEKGSRNVTKLC